jgi:hypothetical protein
MRRPGQAIFGLPGFLRLELVRHLTLVTHTRVSRFQSCFTYEIFSTMKALRTVRVAMKSPHGHGEPDVDSCLEALNLVLWIPHHVHVGFEATDSLVHHNHPSWVRPHVLRMYFDVFQKLRGAGLGRWTADISIAYDRGLDLARTFRIM